MNIVLIAAWILAAVSAFFVHPDSAYLGYIDFHTLGLLFCLMAVVAGLSQQGIFSYMAQRLLENVKNSRQLELILVFLCFFTSMIITNDVALITFVPFAIEVLTLTDMKKCIIPVVVFQTVAANLGSMMTPIGNPQNLYLYSCSGQSAFHMFMLMLPYGLMSAVLLLICLLCRKNTVISDLQLKENVGIKDKRIAGTYGVLFVLCLFAVAHVLPVWSVTVAVLLVVFIADRTVLKKVDYSLLLTFAGFFIFIGNMGRIPAFCNALNAVLNGHEMITAVAASQVISNVPAALLLSGFTAQYDALIIGTNIGGLGTLIASMASLISFRFAAQEKQVHKGAYLGYFTVVNVIFLAVLLLEYVILTYIL